MKHRVLRQLLLAASLIVVSPLTAAIEDSVVKIFATVQYPDFYRPWTKQPPQETSGTGVVIEGKRILTNAHVVLYASQVQVQAHQSGDRLTARVEFVAPGIDLAVLTLEEEEFFDDRPAVPRAARLPQIKDTVLAYGYPTGGNSLSITKGIVSRIEFSPYSFNAAGLRIQIDAAINPGNSGGPALSGEEMIGLAVSRLGGGDNIGYIIPNEEIDLFLGDIADGSYDGKPSMVDQFQKTENPALRAFLKLDRNVEGVAVIRPDPYRPDSPLREWDVVTHIAGVNIDNEGMIKLGENLRVYLQYQLQLSARDGHVPLTILRDGETKEISLPVPAVRAELIDGLAGGYPPYFICGPLVLTPVTTEFLAGLNNLGFANLLAGVGSPLMTRRAEVPSSPDEEMVVVAAPFFPHRIAKGYQPPAWQVISSINGTSPRNLAHAVELLRDVRGRFVEIRFAGHSQESVVFDHKELLDVTEEILSDNGVRSQGTPELMRIWNAGR